MKEEAIKFNEKFLKQFDTVSYSEISNLLDATRYNFKQEFDANGNCLYDYKTTYFDWFQKLNSEISTFIFSIHDGEKYVNAAPFLKLYGLDVDTNVKGILIRILNDIGIQKLINEKVTKN